MLRRQSQMRMVRMLTINLKAKDGLPINTGTTSSSHILFPQRPTNESRTTGSTGSVRRYRRYKISISCCPSRHSCYCSEGYHCQHPDLNQNVKTANSGTAGCFLWSIRQLFYFLPADMILNFYCNCLQGKTGNISSSGRNWSRAHAVTGSYTRCLVAGQAIIWGWRILRCSEGQTTRSRSYEVHWWTFQAADAYRTECVTGTVKKLLGNVDNPEEEEIESLCKLLATVSACSISGRFAEPECYSSNAVHAPGGSESLVLFNYYLQLYMA